MILDLEYNGIRCSELGLFIKEMPSVPAAKRKRDSTEIPGRDGALYSTHDCYEETEINVSFNYIGKPEKWMERWREVQRWLSARNAMLLFSDDPEYFYKISHVTLDENMRASARVGEFKAAFTSMDGISYAKSGIEEHPIEDVLWNPYGMSKPVYIITGEGECTLQVNGRSMRANVGQNLTIDTGRMLAYRADGTWRNTDVAGDYEELYLREGENAVTITPGFTLKIIPNWRCL